MTTFIYFVLLLDTNKYTKEAQKPREQKYAKNDAFFHFGGKRTTAYNCGFLWTEAVNYY